VLWYQAARVARDANFDVNFDLQLLAMMAHSITEQMPLPVMIFLSEHMPN
jgi:hypothetical protein